MALKFFEGFEHFSNSAQFLRKYVVVSGATIQQTGRLQGFAAQVNNRRRGTGLCLG